MARPLKKEEEIVDYNKCVLTLIERVNELEERIVELEKVKPSVKNKATINRVEEFNGETSFEPEETNSMRMLYEDKIQSMKNAIAILPPNMVDANGRQLKENVQAIVGFIVDDTMLDEAYQGINIEP